MPGTPALEPPYGLVPADPVKDSHTVEVHIGNNGEDVRFRRNFRLGHGYKYQLHVRCCVGCKCDGCGEAHLVTLTDEDAIAIKNLL